MKKLKYTLFVCILLCFSQGLLAQHAHRQYRASEEIKVDLEHTKLSISFDFQKSHVLGEAWIQLKPHFYPVDKVVLDAKEMLIHKVEIANQKAEFNYSDNELTVYFGKTLSKKESLMVYVNYTARPNRVQGGSKAINDAKGLYFINPKGEDSDTPTQIWTQGETESSSCWFPTIDSPNQKTSQEILLTVPDKYVTLSNGKLLSSDKNANGTRTDYWKQELKHAPYLFFVGVGEFSIVKDAWRNKEVNYYVEKEYEPYAREIFGMTPKMMDFYSSLTGIDYPWDKYSQIVGREFVSGAMENTGAVIHEESVYQYPGQLIDENIWESTIAHELFHHWFGNLVTTESWANLTVNESFANYGEYLWFEHAYGRDFADAHLIKDRNAYLGSKTDFSKDLVRFDYSDKEDMFDVVSYNKGGAILHMLRNYVGDEAFFEGLKRYLKENSYSTGEAHQLRLALEKISGKDLNWFFNQWYFGAGHIEAKVRYSYNESTSKQEVTIQQVDKVFEFPLTIHLFEGTSMATHNVWVNQKEQTFSLNCSVKPSLTTIDPEGILLANFELARKKEKEAFIFQYQHEKSYRLRMEALDALKEYKDDKEVYEVFKKALDDPFYKIQAFALSHIDLSRVHTKKDVVTKIEKMASQHPKTIVQGQAIQVLGKLVDSKYKNAFEKALTSESYAVAGSGLLSLFYIDKDAALTKAKTLPANVKDNIASALVRMYIEEKEASEMPYISKHVLKGIFYKQEKKVKDLYEEAYEWISTSNNKEAISVLTDEFVAMGLKYKEYNADKVSLNYMLEIVNKQQKSTNTNKQEIIQTVREGMAKLVD